MMKNKGLFVVGIGAGIAIGTALHNVAVGIAIGAAIGVLLSKTDPSSCERNLFRFKKR